MKKTEFEYQYIGKCVLCDKAFTPRSVLLLGRFEELSEVYVQCSECKSSFFIYFIKTKIENAKKLKVNVIPIITDMSKSDIGRLKEMVPITEAEVKALDKV